MPTTKAFIEIILDVDGNLPEASKRLCDQIKQLNCVEENYSYKIQDVKFSNGWIKGQKPMKVDRSLKHAWK